MGAVKLGQRQVDVRRSRVEDEVAERADVVRRRVSHAAHPGERRHRQHARAVPDRRTDVVQNLIGQRVPVHDRRVGEDVRNPAHARRIAVRGRADLQRVAAEVRLAAGDRATFLVVVASAPRPLEERRRAHRVVHRHRGRVDAVVVFPRVVPAGNGAADRIVRLLVHEVLAAQPQVPGHLIVGADDGLIAEQRHRVRIGLEVERLARRHRDIRRREPVQDRHAWSVQPILRNPSEHASVREARHLALSRCRRPSVSGP